MQRVSVYRANRFFSIGKQLLSYILEIVKLLLYMGGFGSKNVNEPTMKAQDSSLLDS